MTATIAKKESEIVAPSQSEHSANLRKLADKENILSQTESIFQQIEVKNQSLAKLQQTASGLKQRTEDLSLSASMTDSRTAYAISLYSRISNISWDYAASAPDTTLKGCTCQTHDSCLVCVSCMCLYVRTSCVCMWVCVRYMCYHHNHPCFFTLFARRAVERVQEGNARLRAGCLPAAPPRGGGHALGDDRTGECRDLGSRLAISSTWVWYSMG
ncbi:hypothetical protein EON64_13480 [archaeon]|nr:MAG: hypothetical protein EON64_13480 [archaeon]